MKWDLDGKVGLVTGGGSGIGQEVALRLAGEGVAVALVDLDASRAEATAAVIEKAGGHARALCADVSDSLQVSEAVARARELLGPIDYLVNIAGFHQRAAIHDITDSQWHRMLNVHLSGTFYCCRSIVPDMISRRSGRIVNMSSVHASGRVPFGAHYSAAKAGIVGLTKALAQEVAPQGILVNAVSPGPIDTPLWREGLSETELEARKARRTPVIPLGRIGQPREVADVIVFLLSPASSHITGQVININGGEVMV